MRPLAIAAVCLSACTTLGPIPATTGISAVPNGRPGIEAQAAIVPGYFLSDAAQQSSAGQPTGQLSLLLEPDRWLQVPGLIVGVRRFGSDTDSLVEPYLGYRHRIEDVLSLAAIGYGTSTSASQTLATYHATRLGLEVAADVRLLQLCDWVAVHGQVSGAITELHASGTYCVDTNGVGIDCSTDGTQNTMVDGHIDGAFASGTAQLSLDIGRRPTGVLHDIRIAVLAAVGEMPQLSFGTEQTRATYQSWGLSLTVGLGDDK
jgi:hypothetical protein